MKYCLKKIFICVFLEDIIVALATHLQRTPASGAMLPQNSWLQPAGVIQSNQNLQVCQQKLRLHSLQMERERLKQRQQEIMRSQVST